jgi:hypothetical protein
MKALVYIEDTMFRLLESCSIRCRLENLARWKRFVLSYPSFELGSYVPEFLMRFLATKTGGVVAGVQ